MDKNYINELREEIGQVLQDNTTVFQSVYSFPKATLDGFPAGVIVPSENDADYGSTATDRLVFAFTVNIYYPIRNETEYEKSEMAIGEAVAETINAFTQRNILTKCDWVEPVPSIWGETTVGETVYRTARIILRCVKYMGH